MMDASDAGPTVAIDELEGDGAEGVSPPRRLGATVFLALLPRIAAAVDEAEGAAGELARRLEVQPRVWSQGDLGRLAVDAAAHRPGLGARFLHDQIQSRAPAVGDFPPRSGRFKLLDREVG